MPTEKYDAYGVTLPDGSGKREAASTALDRLGQCVFWLLVAVIVSVRILTYPAIPAFDVGSASASQQTVTR